MKRFKFFPIAAFFVFALTACGNNETTSESSTQDTTATTAQAGISAADWGEVDGKKVSLYTLTNKNGVQVKITNYGGIVTSWITPDKAGQKSDVVLGFNDLQGYLAKPPYFGALIGRYGNRI